MPTDHYNETLASVINTDLIPQELNFLEGGVNALFSDLFIRYNVHTLYDGAGTSYNGTLRARKKLSFKIPGTELELILNPDFNPNLSDYTSSIPFYLHLQKAPFFRNFNISNFGGSPAEFINILIDYLDISDNDLMRFAAYELMPDKTLESLIDFINTEFSMSPNLEYPDHESYEANIDELIDTIYTHPTFIAEEKDCKDIWAADDLVNGVPHQSVKKLRERAEAFAHFWYQFQYNREAIGGVLWAGNYQKNWVIFKFAKDLLKNNSNQVIRFERPGHLTLNTELSNCLANSSTDNTELDWVLNYFLVYIKSHFETEKSTNNY